MWCTAWPWCTMVWPFSPGSATAQYSMTSSLGPSMSLGSEALSNCKSGIPICAGPMASMSSPPISGGPVNSSPAGDALSSLSGGPSGCKGSISRSGPPNREPSREGAAGGGSDLPGGAISTVCVELALPIPFSLGPTKKSPKEARTPRTRRTAGGNVPARLSPGSSSRHLGKQTALGSAASPNISSAPSRSWIAPSNNRGMLPAYVGRKPSSLHVRARTQP
mmetsp:Transcript_48863/g.152861  ORF Transcript_48863/g.152861 Transcript_48863/m.152861 type:complete len:221 (+) Transcript_48863:1514-2176(+)